ncbi:MAG: hypothetical protein GX629_02255, partial [Phycisphaerae bacterium]|nr:hypothetical protein [Phycisphaerae bacterium]
MDIENKFAALLEVCSKLAMEVRPERLGGSGGGICKLKGKSIVFIDLDSEPELRYDRLVADLAKIPQIDTIFLLPEIRTDMERLD